MKFRIFMVILFLQMVPFDVTGAEAPSNWQSWDRYPDVTRYSADQVQDLLVSGEKMILIYAGYETDKIICGSYYLPYTMVPPYGSGARVNLKFPKDTWMVAYCP